MHSIIVACSAILLLAFSATVEGDTCTDNLNRCARVRDQSGFSYEIGDKPVHQWVANLILIDPASASTVCRDAAYYVSTMSCIRKRLTEYACWSTSKYYWTDRYIPEEKTLREAMDVFCDPAQRQAKVNLNNCMLRNARENKKKDECLREEEERSLRIYNHRVNDRSMCSFFHKRMNCFRLFFGALCKATILSPEMQAVTMEEYFDPLRKASICHIIDGANSVSIGLAAILFCLLAHLLY